MLYSTGGVLLVVGSPSTLMPRFELRSHQRLSKSSDLVIRRGVITLAMTGARMTNAGFLLRWDFDQGKENEVDVQGSVGRSNYLREPRFVWASSYAERLSVLARVMV